MQKRSLFTIALLTTGSAARLAMAQTEAPRRLSLSEAQQTALRNHPRIASANLVADAAKSVVTESRSPYYPFVAGNFTSDIVRGDAHQRSKVDVGADAQRVMP